MSLKPVTLQQLGNSNLTFQQIAFLKPKLLAENLIPEEQKMKRKPTTAQLFQ